MADSTLAQGDDLLAGSQAFVEELGQPRLDVLENFIRPLCAL